MTKEEILGLLRKLRHDEKDRTERRAVEARRVEILKGIDLSEIETMARRLKEMVEAANKQHGHKVAVSVRIDPEFPKAEYRGSDFTLWRWDKDTKQQVIVTNKVVA